MSKAPHQLHDDFPEYAATITALKTQDTHFARLLAEYAEANDQIHLAETNVTPMDDLAIIELRKQRSALKDELFALLKAAQPAG